MLYTTPDYYRDFQCIADHCEDTCCAGWQIVVDGKSLEKYKRVKGSFRKRMRNSVDWKEGTFRQDGEKRCAFLNDENLCDMYTALGRNSLCETCRRYPRHVEVFEDVREISLSVSCPEVAKILMNRMEPVHFHSVERDRKDVEEEFEDFDLFLYSQLEDARDVMIGILQDRSMDIDVRIRLIMGIAHDMQRRVNHQQLFSCAEVLEKYKKPTAKEYVERILFKEKQDKKICFAKKAAKEVLLILDSMELLKEDWFVLKEEAKHRLFDSIDDSNWYSITQEWADWVHTVHFPWEIQKEQLMVYFIFTYFCGAVYDGKLYAKACMAAASAAVVEELMKARWLRNDKMLDTEDVIDIVYRYSREIEHSTINLEKLEDKAYEWRKSMGYERRESPIR